MSALKINLEIENSWKNAMDNELKSGYFTQLKLFLLKEKQKNRVFPVEKDIFNAFHYTPFNNVKVVIIGQDPYHSFETINGETLPHAHGLCFSVPTAAKKTPPSLKNIFKEIKQDLGFELPTHGNLSSWAKQGVLLLNATLTVREHKAASHQKQGWETFTDAVIQKLSAEKTGLIFLLWGKFAQNKASLIDVDKHFLLKAAHPSPFSAYNGFFGCNHFSKTNEILEHNNQQKINWEIK